MKKTISFAAIHMGVAFSVGYLMTGDIVVGGTLALVEPMCNTVAYYFHEKVWNKWSEFKKAQQYIQANTEDSGSPFEYPVEV